MSDRKLRLGHLYPSLMNIYGDRGNIVCLMRRCRLRAIELEVVPLEVGEALGDGGFDLLFMGGAQDREQSLVAKDLAETKGDLRDLVEDGVVFLGVCGGYQLSGQFYRGLDGVEMRGAGVFDLFGQSRIEALRGRHWYLRPLEPEPHADCDKYGGDPTNGVGEQSFAERLPGWRWADCIDRGFGIVFAPAVGFLHGDFPSPFVNVTSRSMSPPAKTSSAPPGQRTRISSTR